jgi:hypothetical protein
LHRGGDYGGAGGAGQGVGPRESSDALYEACPQIAISAVSYLQIVYRDGVALPAPVAMGAVWEAVYWGVVLSHAALGLIAVSAGLI